MGKVIYQPKGAAKEYARWACNLYNGCPHGCEYCYCKRGFLGHTLGKDIPLLKKGAGKDFREAFRTFYKELHKYEEQIKADGESLFFSFSTDPMCDEEVGLTMQCVQECIIEKVPVQILTKATKWRENLDYIEQLKVWRNYITIGFTLTGHDELEPNAPTNSERIKAMHILFNHTGIKEFASIEPIVDFKSSLRMIQSTIDCCPEYRIGLMSGIDKEKQYNPQECEKFVRRVTELQNAVGFKLVWKNSIKEYYTKHLPLHKMFEL